MSSISSSSSSSSPSRKKASTSRKTVSKVKRTAAPQKTARPQQNPDQGDPSSTDISGIPVESASEDNPIDQLREERERARRRLEKLKEQQLKAQVVSQQLMNEQLKAEKLAEKVRAEEHRAEVISEQKVAAELKAQKEAKMREKALKEALKQAEKIKAEQVAIEREAADRREEQKRLKDEAAKLRREKEEAQKIVAKQQAAREEAERKALEMEAILKEEERREQELAMQLEAQERKREAALRRAAQERRMNASRHREGKAPLEDIPASHTVQEDQPHPKESMAPAATPASTQPKRMPKTMPKTMLPPMDVPALKSGDTGTFKTRETLDPEAEMMERVYEELHGFEPVKSKQKNSYKVTASSAPKEDKTFPTMNIAVAVIQKKSKFLLVQETKGWYFPAGRPRGNESLIEAAKREALYKGGIEVEGKGVIRVEHTVLPSHARLRTLFLCKQTDQNEPKQEANSQSFRADWFDLKSLDNIKLRTQEVPLIMEAILYGYTVAPMSFFTIEGAPW